MSIHTKREFAKLCGIVTRELAVYIKRNKVVVSEAGLIDDTNSVNKIFMESRAGRKKKDPEKVTEPTEKPKRDDREDLYDLEKQQKTVAIEAKRREMALTDARLQKMHGVLIPTDVAKMVVAQQFRELSMEIKQGIDSLLSEIGKKARLNGNQVTEFRALITKMVNESVNRAVDNSKKNVQKIVSEFAGTKNAA
jgi:hypothetical protein